MEYLIYRAKTSWQLTRIADWLVNYYFYNSQIALRLKFDMDFPSGLNGN